MRKIILLIVLVFCLVIITSTNWKNFHHKWFEGNLEEIQKEHPHPRDRAISEMNGLTGNTKLEKQMEK
jgi:hypothetical protein